MSQLQEAFAEEQHFDDEEWFDQEPEPEIEFGVVHCSYAGCSDPAEWFCCEEDALAYLQKLLARRKAQGFEVEQLEERSWEVIEPEGAVMVPAAAGTLSFRNRFKR